MIGWLSPYHRNSKRHGTTLLIEPVPEVRSTSIATNMWRPAFVLISNLAPKIAVISLPNHWSKRTFLCGKCRFTAHITKVISAIYTLSRHFEVTNANWYEKLMCTTQKLVCDWFITEEDISSVNVMTQHNILAGLLYQVRLKRRYTQCFRKKQFLSKTYCIIKTRAKQHFLMSYSFSAQQN